MPNSEINNQPEVLTNSIYTPGFLRTQIGRLMRVILMRNSMRLK